jgi:hypothetical protein
MFAISIFGVTLARLGALLVAFFGDAFGAAGLRVAGCGFFAMLLPSRLYPKNNAVTK